VKTLAVTKLKRPKSTKNYMTGAYYYMYIWGNWKWCKSYWHSNRARSDYTSLTWLYYSSCIIFVFWYWNFLNPWNFDWIIPNSNLFNSPGKWNKIVGYDFYHHNFTKKKSIKYNCHISLSHQINKQIKKLNML
jgi:hypothetical protein